MRTPTAEDMAWTWLCLYTADTIGQTLSYRYDVVRDLGIVAVHLVNDGLTSFDGADSQYQHPEVSLTLDEGLQADALCAARELAAFLGLPMDRSGTPLNWPVRPIERWIHGDLRSSLRASSEVLPQRGSNTERDE